VTERAAARAADASAARAARRDVAGAADVLRSATSAADAGAAATANDVLATEWPPLEKLTPGG
jgi:hypothetical protein